MGMKSLPFWIKTFFRYEKRFEFSLLKINRNFNSGNFKEGIFLRWKRTPRKKQPLFHPQTRVQEVPTRNRGINHQDFTFLHCFRCSSSCIMIKNVKKAFYGYKNLNVEEKFGLTGKWLFIQHNLLNPMSPWVESWLQC